jgi:hypothetical protein
MKSKIKKSKTKKSMWLKLLGLFFMSLLATPAEAQWKRHTIDNSSRGADGIRLADFNGDGRQDMVTGWEEGGKVRVYLSPDSENIKSPWPAVTVGNVASPEDAVAADIDGDGEIDVLSSCEGRNRSLYIHWAPARSKMLQSNAWKTDQIPVTAKKQSWMFALPMQIDGDNGIDFFVSAKGGDAWISWLEAPKDARDLKSWKLHPIYKAGWIMSLLPVDMDGDGDVDILSSDRKGSSRGILWLENPGTKPPPGIGWKVHRINDDLGEVMFLTVGDIDHNKTTDIACAVKGKGISLLMRKPGKSIEYESVTFPLPPNSGTAKAVAITDVDLDGQNDIVYTCENAHKELHGVRWGSYDQKPNSGRWTWNDVSGPTGIKFDLIKMMDLDRDGDLDIVTCEERANLGVFWYENPTK